MQKPYGTQLEYIAENREKVELFLDEKVLQQVLRRKIPTRYFWEDMSDLYMDGYPDEWIDRCFAVMALTPHHTHMVLTKRAARQREYVRGVNSSARFHDLNLAAQNVCRSPGYGAVLPTQQDGMVSGGWPLPHVWLGVSVEDQATADERIPLLLQTPAAVRFVSYEPALGPISFEFGRGQAHDNAPYDGKRIDWIICGGESGPGARPMHPGWARLVRDQCQAAGAAFHF